MRVAVIETDAQGGLIHFAYQFAEGLAEVGAAPTLVTARGYELASLPHRAKLVPLLRLWPQVEEPPASALGRWLRRRLWPVRRAWRAAVLAWQWWRLTRYLKRARPDVAVFSMIRFRFIGLYLRHLQRCGIRMTQICHEFDNREQAARPGLAARVSAALTAALPDPYACFERIFLLSESTRADFCRASPAFADRASVLGHGPELLFASDAATAARVTSHYQITDGQKIVLMVGSLRPSKGAVDLIDAFARLADAEQRASPTRLIIAGYPSREFDSAALVHRIQQFQLADRVMLDFRYLEMGELGALVARADVVVFPYRSATASGVLSLAQSLGSPAVATAVGGLADAIEHGVTGWLVPPQDPVALADRLAAVLKDAQAAQAVAAQARRRLLADNAWDRVAQRFLDACAKDSDEPVAGFRPT